MHFRPIILLLAVLVGAGLSAEAQAPPVTVPDESLLVPDDANMALKTSLDKQYELLAQRFTKWNTDATAFNDRYGGKNLDADTQDAKDGLAEQTRLSNALDVYSSDADQFKEAVNKLRLKLGSYGRVGLVRGECYFLAKDGRKVTITDTGYVPVGGDTRVLTGPNSRLQLLLPDETVFTLGPNSDMVLDAFIYDPSISAAKAAAQFVRGTFRWVTGKVSKNRDIEIKFNVGAIGPRGTDFECMIDPANDGYIMLHEGQLEITKNKTGEKIELDAGQMISFTAAGTFSEPKPLDSTLTPSA
jgi:hypothetical protein